MHNLFLGLAQHHCQVALGLDVPLADEDMMNADPKDIIRALEILDNGPTQATLRRVPLPALRAACQSKGLPVSKHEKPRKKDLIAALMVSTSSDSLINLC